MGLCVAPHRTVLQRELVKRIMYYLKRHTTPARIRLNGHTRGNLLSRGTSKCVKCNTIVRMLEKLRRYVKRAFRQQIRKTAINSSRDIEIFAANGFHSTVTKSPSRGENPPGPPFEKGGDFNVFSWFQGVPKGHEIPLRKDLMGCAPLHPSYGSFHDFGVFRRDVRYCLEKFQARCEIPPALPCPPLQKGGDWHVFSWFQGVSKGRKILLRKDLMGCAPLHPSYGRSTDLFMVSECPEGA